MVVVTNYGERDLDKLPLLNTNIQCVVCFNLVSSVM